MDYNCMKKLLLILAFFVSASHADVFDQWVDIFPHTEIGARAWDGNTGLAEYTRRGRDGSIEAHGWYLVELDEAGRIDWFKFTDQSPVYRYPAETAQAADAATTIVGVGAGLAELNPIGVPGVLIAKVGLLHALKRGSAKACYESIGTVTSLGWGAAAWNIGAIAGLGPAAAIPAIATLFAPEMVHNEKFWACAPSI